MTTSPKIPELCAGDVLTRDEFERRYAAMPNLKKAELIEGVVYMPSPVRYTQHGNPHFLLSRWLGVYCDATPGVDGASDSTIRLDQDNEPQPDLMLRITGPRGSSRIDADGYLQGPPELVVEVAASSVSYDLHQKLAAYRRNGVAEYLVLRTEDAAVDWFVLRRGTYERQLPDPAGLLRSERFAGLWLDPAALLRGDAAALRAAVDRGLADPAHAGFVGQLAV
ncbi:MAG: Uma2 family endonuclease [Planctomycetota bacterium]